MGRRSLLGVGGIALLAFPVATHAQTTLPTLNVDEHAPRATRHRTLAKHSLPQRGHAAPPRLARRGATGQTTSGGAGGADATGGANGTGGAVANESLAAARAGESAADATRARLLPVGPANAATITRANITALPRGDQTGFDQVLLQLPGVTQDSSGSGDFHIRNEHANAQYRINGIFLPEGVSGFSQVLDSAFIRSVTLLDGALPAQYGLRTAGIIDIQTRNGAEDPGTTATIYGGSHRTVIPTISQAGTIGRWDYFLVGRYTSDDLGIENPLPTHEAIHDATRQGRYFAYVSGVLEDSSRLTFMSGAGLAHYQIPNSPGVAPAFTAFGASNFDSTLLNESQTETSIFNVIAWQKSFGAIDTQVSFFQRYSTLHFTPDPLGDLIFNGVASDVTRTSFVNGLQADNAWRTSTRNTVRFGAIGSIERAAALDNNVVLPLAADGTAIDAPFAVADAERKTGLTGGLYVQDEYQLTPQLAITGGLRYDAYSGYVTTDQLSPRLGAVYKPDELTTIHAGYARYFTPPELSLSGPTPLGLYTNTTLQPGVALDDPVRPERSHYFDAGVTRRVLPGLDLGVDAYYKIAKNLLDDGQFGQALVLTAFNYDHAYNQGVEFKGNYVAGNFRAYGNLAVAQQRAKTVSSNQYLFDPDELAYIANNYIYTDHDQLITVSGGASYKIHDTLLSTDIIYGSGLRNGFANIGTVSPYAVVNVGVAQDLWLIPGHQKPTTFRIAVVNLFDHPYAIRDGSGIGVFQAQYGQRRGVFASLSQRF